MGNMTASGAGSARREPCTLRGLAIFSDFSPPELDRLEALAVPQSMGRHEMIFREGDHAAAFFIVTDGVVRTFRMLGDGRRQIVGFLFPGDFLGLALGQAYVHAAEAAAEVSLCRYAQEHLETLMREMPRLEAVLLRNASNELAAAQEQMLLLGRKRTDERIASFLLMLFRREERHGRDGRHLQLPMTREDIADYLGLTVETTSRLFTRFKNDGLIAEPRRNAIQLLDLETLGELAGLDDTL